MSDGKKYYCFCGSNCKYETMTKEQILAAITQAASGSSVIDPDAAVVSKVKETNSGGAVTFWVGTQAEYNALESVAKDCLYIITNDSSVIDLQNAMRTLQEATEEAHAATEKAVAAAAKNLEVQDVSADIIFSFMPSNSTASAMTAFKPIEHRLLYYPALNKVWLEGRFSFNGSFKAGDSVCYLQIGGYKSTGITFTPMAVYSGNGDNLWEVAHNGEFLWFAARRDFSTNKTIGFTISGWYDCKGA